MGLPLDLQQTSNSPHRRYLMVKLLLLLMVILAFVIIFLTYVIYRVKPVKSVSALQLAAFVAARQANLSSNQTIASSLGFRLVYNSNFLSASGQTTNSSSTKEYISGQEYFDDELRQVRDYSIVKIRPKVPDKLSPTPLELVIVTNIRKNYLIDRLNLPANKGKKPLQVYEDQVIADEKSADSGVLIERGDITISGLSYRKLTFTHIDSSYGLKTKTTDFVYITVQNERPYSASIKSISDRDLVKLADFEAVIKTISYQAPDASKLSMIISKLKGRFLGSAHASDSPLSGETTKVYGDLDPATIMEVVAKNQPSVVRILTSGCTDITLRSNSGSSFANISDTCSAGIGSGTFISNDGFIATNGHVVDLPAKTFFLASAAWAEPDQVKRSDNIKKIVNFAQTLGRIDEGNAAKLISGYISGDTVAFQKIDELLHSLPSDRINIGKYNPKYSIQTSNTPFHIRDNKYNVDYTGGIVAAKFVAMNFDPSSLSDEQYQSTGASDVAILKADGHFPIVRLGSVDDVHIGDTLTAIGFPVFVDGGFNTTEAKTVPSATQGLLESIQTEDSGGYKILYTNVPIAPGNSGGPAFANNGQQIGLNTYGVKGCDDGNCYGDGRVRDIQDLKDLAAKSKVSLRTDDHIGDNWRQGIDALVAGDKSVAVNKFQQSMRDYPNNYLALAFIKLAQDPSSDLGAYKRAHTEFAVTPARRSYKYMLYVAIGLFVSVLIGLVAHLVNSHKSQTAQIVT